MREKNIIILYFNFFYYYIIFFVNADKNYLRIFKKKILNIGFEPMLKDLKSSVLNHYTNRAYYFLNL